MGEGGQLGRVGARVADARLLPVHHGDDPAVADEVVEDVDVAVAEGQFGGGGGAFAQDGEGAPQQGIVRAGEALHARRRALQPAALGVGGIGDVERAVEAEGAPVEGVDARHHGGVGVEADAGVRGLAHVESVDPFEHGEGRAERGGVGLHAEDAGHGHGGGGQPPQHRGLARHVVGLEDAALALQAQGHGGQGRVREGDAEGEVGGAARHGPHGQRLRAFMAREAAQPGREGVARGRVGRHRAYSAGMTEYGAPEPPADERAAPAMSRLWWIPGMGAAGLALAAVFSPVIVSDGGGAEPYLDFREGGILLYNAVVVAGTVVVQTVTAFTSHRMPLTTIAGMLVSVNALLLGLMGWRLMEAEIARRVVDAAVAGLDAGNPRIGIGVWLAIAAGAVLSVVHARAVAFCFREDGRRSIWAR